MGEAGPHPVEAAGFLGGVRGPLRPGPRSRPVLTAALLLAALLFCGRPAVAAPPRTSAAGPSPSAGAPTPPPVTAPDSAAPPPVSPAARSYPWLAAAGRPASPEPGTSLAERIPVPAGYRRVPLPPGSFGDWLRHLPLLPGRPPVRLFSGAERSWQDGQLAVVDLDVGASDLQQCADTIIRLRAEYLLSRGLSEQIHFDFSSGDRAEWRRWREGYRPRVQDGRHVRWVRAAGRDASRRSLRAYLDAVFTYAGSASLSRELRPVPRPEALQVGDVFIQGGFPGHAVIVLDLAKQPASGERRFLLGQGFMPAQQLHLLADPSRGGSDPWYGVSPALARELVTPDYRFGPAALRTWAPAPGAGSGLVPPIGCGDAAPR